MASRVLGWALLATVVFAPWAFGSTQSWAIVTLGTLSCLCGGLAVVVRRVAQPVPDSTEATLERWLIGALCLVPLYTLVGVLNASSVLDLTRYRLVPLPHVRWLPHSFDPRLGGWTVFRQLSLVSLFWAVRVWLLGGHRNRHSREGVLPRRHRQLGNVIVLNGLALALVAMAQYVDGSGYLLWLVKPAINQYAFEQFGPFAYRTNGFAYLVLVWPVALALWAMWTNVARSGAVFGSGWRLFLLCSALMLAGITFFWVSRLAWVVTAVVAASAVLILMATGRRRRWRLLPLGVVLFVLSFAIAVNWTILAQRVEKVGWGSAERVALMNAGWRMFRDNKVFGTGPGTFVAVYGNYRAPWASWQTHLHSDWLQSLAAYGVVGGVLVLAVVGLYCAVICRRRPGGVGFNVMALLFLGPLGCLAYAWVDFPLQLFSIQHLFTVVCALVSTLRTQGEL